MLFAFADRYAVEFLRIIDLRISFLNILPDYLLSLNEEQVREHDLFFEDESNRD